MHVRLLLVHNRKDKHWKYKCEQCKLFRPKCAKNLQPPNFLVINKLKQIPFIKGEFGTFYVIALHSAERKHVNFWHLPRWIIQNQEFSVTDGFIDMHYLQQVMINVFWKWNIR